MTESHPRIERTLIVLEWMVSAALVAAMFPISALAADVKIDDLIVAKNPAPSKA
jgi:hypothetical protein